MLAPARGKNGRQVGADRRVFEARIAFWFDQNIMIVRSHFAPYNGGTKRQVSWTLWSGVAQMVGLAKEEGQSMLSEAFAACKV